MNYLHDKYICEYDGSMVNLSNFDTCLFYSIPYKKKIICLNGFDKNEIKSSTDDNENTEAIIYSKNKIQSIIVNKIMNNMKTRKNYENINIFYYSSKKSNTSRSEYIKLNYKYLSGKKYVFTILDNISDVYYKINNKDEDNLNIIILDSIDLVSGDEKKNIYNLILNFESGNYWIIIDFDKNVLSSKHKSIIKKLKKKILCNIYSSDSTQEQITQYYLDDFVECVADIKYLYNTFEKLRRKQIHLVTLREKKYNQNKYNLKYSPYSSNTSDSTYLLEPIVMAFVPYKIKKGIHNSLCDSETTSSSNPSNIYRELKINTFQNYNMLNEKLICSNNKSELESDTELEVDSELEVNTELEVDTELESDNISFGFNINHQDKNCDSKKILTTETSTNTESKSKKNISYSTEYMVGYLTNKCKMKKNIEKVDLKKSSFDSTTNFTVSLLEDDELKSKETNNKKNICYSTEYLAEYLVDSYKKPKKVSKKVLKKDIFIKKNNLQQKQNSNAKNIQFTIGSNIQININF